LFGTTSTQDIQFQFSDIDSVELHLQLNCPPLQLACGAGAIFDSRKRMGFAEASLNVPIRPGTGSGLSFNKAAIVSDIKLEADAELFYFD